MLELDDCRRLWRAVLVQAAWDAIRTGNEAKGSGDSRIPYGSLDWFDTQACDLICSRVQIDRRRLRRRVHELHDEFKRHPSKAGARLDLATLLMEANQK